MTVSLRELIEEWEVINRDLYLASLESHRRYPFPNSPFGRCVDADSPLSSSSFTPAPPLPSESSTAVYARVYHLISCVRHLAEDARYTSIQVVQHLLWISLVGWANQLAIASGGAVRLPDAVKCSRHKAEAGVADDGGAAKAAEALFPCALLPPLVFWDPRALARAAGSPQQSPTTPDSVADAAPHREPNLPQMWRETVLRILSTWCSPNLTASTATAPSQQPMTVNVAFPPPLSSPPPPPPHARQPAPHLADAYVWVLVAQHYHRLKAILSLFFLRYDAVIEDVEEQLRSTHPPRHRPTPFGGGGWGVDGTGSGMGTTTSPPPPPPRRRGPHVRVSSDIMAATAFLAATQAARAPTAPQQPPSLSSTPASSHLVAGRLSPSSSSNSATAPLPTTARLLSLMMRSIELLNMDAITAATGQAVIFVLMPPAHRARLREKVLTAHQQQQREKSQSEGAAAIAGGDGGAARGAASLLTEPEAMASAFLNGWVADKGEEEEEDEKVVWSAPPSPLLTFSGVTESPSNASLTPPGEEEKKEDDAAAAEAVPCGDTATSGAAAAVSRTQPPAAEEINGARRGAASCVLPQPLVGRAQKEEYVVRNVFKLLLMAEDCRVHALQHWLVEAGKHVVAVYGSQLASLILEESAEEKTDDGRAEENNNNGALAGDSGGGSKSSSGGGHYPALTVRTLADANRVLRETLQSYVRLRTKLLFLNAGTTHYLEALTPWGRTRMLENLNAFLCGFCGVTLPSSSSSSSVLTAQEDAATAPAAQDGAARYFTPTNAAVAAFTRTWGVPLWLAMCDDTQQRLDELRRAKEKREQHRSSPGTLRAARRPCPGDLTIGTESAETAMGAAGEKTMAAAAHTGEADAQSPKAKSPSQSDRRSATDGRDHSVVSGDLGDAVSRTPSVAWPPSSPTSGHPAGRLMGGGGGPHALSRARGRGLDLKRVLQQQQRRLTDDGAVLQRLPIDLSPHHRALAVAAAEAGGSDGGALEESLYSAETLSNANELRAAGDEHAVTADGSAVTGLADAEGRWGEQRGGNDGGGVPANSVEAAVAAARRRRRRAAAAAHEQGNIVAPPGSTQRFSRAAQLHQVATLPDEGFPSLLYLMPRRSRFVAQDKAAASVQQELFTRFSSDVHQYLTTYLAEWEAAGEKAEPSSASSTGGRQRRSKKTRKDAAVAAVEGEVRPLPQPVVARMTFLLDMTYAALQGSGLGDGVDCGGLAHPPLMETGLTATGQEQGAAILEQDNGEFESVVSTTLSAPTSPAVLTIAAVRKGFQGFLAGHEKRAVLTLAQAFYGVVQQAKTQTQTQTQQQQQQSTLSLAAVDTILNMASLLNSKDMFVSLVKGYLAPQVMMCHSLADIAAESQAVARLAYRLGSAVAAPCLTLLRDLRMAVSDPLSSLTAPPPVSQAEDGADPHVFGTRGAAVTDMAAEGSQLTASRDAQTLAAAGPLRHELFGLIHHVRVLCQAWWQPHTAVLLSSRRLQRLWERYELLDERLVDAVLRVEWRYDGHTEPFYGYGRVPGDLAAGAGQGRDAMAESASSHVSLSGSDGHHRRHSPRGGASTTAVPGTATSAGGARRNNAAAAVIQGFSSVLGNAVRRTGHHAGAFGNNESDNESEDYSEAYGGLLTLSTLQRHRGSYAASASSFRGSNVSSMGGGGGGGEVWDTSDGGQSNRNDEAASTTGAAAPPLDGERVRRQLRWPLGAGQLVFLLLPKAGGRVPGSAPASAQAVHISGPPLTLLVCQLLDRAAQSPYTFDQLHKALPVQTPKPLLAHLLHELVRAGVVLRGVPAGTRQYTYQLCEDTQSVEQRKVVVEVQAAAQQQWVVRTLAAADTDSAEDAERASLIDPMSPASPAAAAAGPVFAHDAADAFSRHARHRRAEAKASHTEAAAPGGGASHSDPDSPAYSAERAHKVKVCTVRIMKAERVLAHRELFDRVAAALEDQFLVTSGQFKRCVAHLIEKEFIQRSESGEEYIYLS